MVVGESRAIFLPFSEIAGPPKSWSGMDSSLAVRCHGGRTRYKGIERKYQLV